MTNRVVDVTRIVTRDNQQPGAPVARRAAPRAPKVDGSSGHRPQLSPTGARTDSRFKKQVRLPSPEKSLAVPRAHKHAQAVQGRVPSARTVAEVKSGSRAAVTPTGTPAAAPPQLVRQTAVRAGGILQASQSRASAHEAPAAAPERPTPQRTRVHATQARFVAPPAKPEPEPAS